MNRRQLTVSADLGREQIHELGRKAPYHRTIQFPTKLNPNIFK